MSEKQKDDITHIKDKVDKIYDCLYVGNGTPAMMTRMKLAERKELDRTRNRWDVKWNYPLSSVVKVS